jgi:hypothetical protein
MPTDLKVMPKEHDLLFPHPLEDCPDEDTQDLASLARSSGRRCEWLCISELSDGSREIKDGKRRLHGVPARRQCVIKRGSKPRRQRHVERNLQRQGLSVFFRLYSL